MCDKHNHDGIYKEIIDLRITVSELRGTVKWLVNKLKEREPKPLIGASQRAMKGFY